MTVVLYTRKDTNLYNVGIPLTKIPQPELRMFKKYDKVEMISKKEREATPINLALYLINLVGKIENGVF